MSGASAASLEKLAIRANATDARRAADWLTQTANKLDVPDEHLRRLDHCLDEALANIIAHGGEQARAGEILLQFDITQEGGTRRASVTVIDVGKAVNPLSVPARVLPESLDSLEPGGLGLLLMRSYSDEISYRFADGRNHLTFSVRWTHTP